MTARIPSPGETPFGDDVVIVPYSIAIGAMFS